MDVEEVKIIEDIAQNGKKRRKKRNMEKYAPLIFEECYIKNKSGIQKVQNSFELASQDHRLDQKVNPSKISNGYRGIHLFVMCHGF